MALGSGRRLPQLCLCCPEALRHPLGQRRGVPGAAVQHRERPVCAHLVQGDGGPAAEGEPLPALPGAQARPDTWGSTGTLSRGRAAWRPWSGEGIWLVPCVPLRPRFQPGPATGSLSCFKGSAHVSTRAAEFNPHDLVARHRCPDSGQVTPSCVLEGGCAGLSAGAALLWSPLPQSSCWTWAASGLARPPRGASRENPTRRAAPQAHWCVEAGSGRVREGVLDIGGPAHPQLLSPGPGVLLGRSWPLPGDLWPWKCSQAARGPPPAPERGS